MKIKLLTIEVIICLILLGIFYLRPYNTVEFNAATIYYQNYGTRGTFLGHGGRFNCPAIMFDTRDVSGLVKKSKNK